MDIDRGFRGIVAQTANNRRRVFEWLCGSIAFAKNSHFLVISSAGGGIRG